MLWRLVQGAEVTLNNESKASTTCRRSLIHTSQYWCLALPGSFTTQPMKVLCRYSVGLIRIVVDCGTVLALSRATFSVVTHHTTQAALRMTIEGLSFAIDDPPYHADKDHGADCPKMDWMGSSSCLPCGLSL